MEGLHGMKMLQKRMAAMALRRSCGHLSASGEGCGGAVMRPGRGDVNLFDTLVLTQPVAHTSGCPWTLSWKQESAGQRAPGRGTAKGRGRMEEGEDEVGGTSLITTDCLCSQRGHIRLSFL